MTKLKIALAAAAVGFVTLAAGQTSAETAVAPMTPIPAIAHGNQVDDGLLQKVQYGHCRYWRHECAERWGWRTHGWYRCMRHHDC